jgi:hypothetical protein
MNCSSLDVGMKQIAKDKRRGDAPKSLVDDNVTLHRIAV